MQKKTFVDYYHVEPIHSDIHARLLNWARWVRDHAATVQQPIFQQYRPPRQYAEDAIVKIDVDKLDGQRMEKAVFALPETNRESIRWWYVKKWITVTEQRKALGLTHAALALAVRDGRQMLKNRLSR